MMLDIMVNTSVRMVLGGAAIWLVLRVVRVRNPHVESLVWRMLLLAGLALPALMYFQLAPGFASAFALPMIEAGGVGGAVESPAAGPGWATPMLVLAAIYLAGALMLVGRLCAGLMSMWRVASSARPMVTDDDVRISPRIASPATFGPIILLPSDSHEWPAERLDAVLAHERAHVRSRDGYWSWLAQLHSAIFWFNPFAWWLRRRLATLAETTSDDAVITARHDPIVYAALLLDFARKPNSRSVAMSVAESNVPGRIERLLARTSPGTELPDRVRWAAFAALIPAVFLAACAPSDAAPTPAAKGEPAANAEAAPALAGSVKITSAPDPDGFYPPAAKQARVKGKVVLQVAVDPEGRLLDVKVLETQPAGDLYGFGAAAMEIARGATYSNSLAQTSTLKFMVKFELAD